jgi:bla regulator protein BlaR1
MSSLTDALYMSAASMALSTLAKVTLVAAAASGILRLTRWASASIRHLVAISALGGILMVPLASVVLPAATIIAPAVSLSSDDSVAPVVGGLEGVASTWSRPMSPPAGKPVRVPTSTLLVAVYVAGVVGSLCPVMFGLVGIRQCRRRAHLWTSANVPLRALAEESGLSRRVLLLISDEIRGPFTSGVIRPVILLPSDAPSWSADHLRRALIHELQHVRRGDWLTGLLTRLVCAVYWFHPLVWTLQRQARFEAERACDDAVLQRADAADYADQLLLLARRLLDEGTAAPTMATHHELAARVASILDQSRPRRQAGVQAGMVAIAVSMAVVSGVAPLRAVALRQSTPASRVESFEVASVKLNHSTSPERFGGFEPGGRFRVVNVPLRQIIAWAYGEQFPVVDEQILGGPSWLDRDRFDINARADGDPSREQMQAMLRALLATRFMLVSREETRELPIYRLLASRGDRSLGPGLSRSTGEDCAARGTRLAAGQRVCGSVGFVAGRGSARAATLDAVARFLVPAVGRVVVNDTGLEGVYSFDVEFAPSQLTATTNNGPTVAQPSLFTVLREQLGLSLESSRAPMKVLVIASVERPTED